MQDRSEGLGHSRCRVGGTAPDRRLSDQRTPLRVVGRHDRGRPGPEGSRTANGSPLKVLVVSSDATSERLLVGALGLATIEVDTRAFREVDAAMAVAADWQPGCLLVDLPPEEWLDVVPPLREASPGAPLLVLADDLDQAMRQDPMALGAQAVIQKAFLGPRLLEQSLLYAVDRARWTAALAEKNRELEERNRRLHEFAGAASHDLKAPLRAINYIVEEALLAEGPEQATTVERNLRDVGDRIKRLYALIDELLASALTSPADQPPFDALVVARDALERLRIPPGFHILFPDTFPQVKGSRTSLGQVFQNLVANAVQHHDRPQGRVRLTWRTVEEMAEFTIEDDGPGMVGPVTMGPPPRGVGLSQVRQLVEGHGGTLTIQPAGARGTRVRFTWPLAAATITR